MMGDNQEGFMDAIASNDNLTNSLVEPSDFHNGMQTTDTATEFKPIGNSFDNGVTTDWNVNETGKADPIAPGELGGEGIVGIPIQSESATIKKGLHLSLVKLQLLMKIGAGIVITIAAIITTVFGIVFLARSISSDYPILRDDFVSTYKQEPVAIYVLKNDGRGGEFQNFTIISISQPHYGVAIFVPGHDFITYQSYPYWAGTDRFEYIASNGHYESMATVYVEVMNRVPITVPQRYLIPKNSAHFKAELFKYVDNVTNEMIRDLDGDQMIIYGASDPLHGKVEITAHALYYSPKKEYVGDDMFNYIITDFNSTATDTITFTMFNSPPEARPFHGTHRKQDIYEAPVLQNSFDINGDDLLVKWAGRPTKGNVQVSPDLKRVVVIPDMEDRSPYTMSFSFGISDGWLESETFAVISYYNHPPQVKNMTIQLSKGNQTQFELQYSDVDPDIVTVHVDQEHRSNLKGQLIMEEIGRVNFSTTAIRADFSNATGWKHIYRTIYRSSNQVYDEEINFQVTDGFNVTSLNLLVHVHNDPPKAANLTFRSPRNASIDINVVSGATDPNGDAISLVKVVSETTTNGGKLVILNETSLRYSAPSSGFIGIERVEYVLTDMDPKQPLQTIGILTIEIYNQPPLPPDAMMFSVTRGHVIEIDVLQGNIKADRGLLLIDEATLKAQEGSNLTIINNKIQMIARTDRKYQEIITYHLKDDLGQLSIRPGKVIVNVTNAPPIVNDVITSISWNRSTIIDVLKNDEDINPGDKQSLRISYLSPPSAGSATVTQQQMILYVPPNGFIGEANFTYRARDGFDESESFAVVTISVSNSAPINVPSTFQKHHLTSHIDLNVTMNDTDPDGDRIALISAKALHGKVSLVSSNARTLVRYVSDRFFVGSDTITYNMTDWNKVVEGISHVLVTNNPPVTSLSEMKVHWNASQRFINVLLNDRDPDNDPISLTNELLPSENFQGNIQITNPLEGIIQFNPSRNFKGAQQITYKATDGPSVMNGTLQIHVTNENIPSVEQVNERIHWRTMKNGFVRELLSANIDKDGDKYSLNVSGSPFANISGDGKNVMLQSLDNLGSEQFTIILSDGMDTSQVPAIVEVYNHPPIAQNFSEIIPWIASTNGIIIDVLSHTMDVDHEDRNFLTITGIGESSLDSNISVVDGRIKYVPHAELIGTEQIYYTVSDGKSETMATMRFTVTSQVTSEDSKYFAIHWKEATQGKSLNVLDGLPGNNKLFNIKSQPQHGAASIAEDGVSVLFKQTLAETEAFHLGTQLIQADYTNEQEEVKVINIFVRVFNAIPVAKTVTFTNHWSQFVNGTTHNAMMNITDEDDSDSLHVSSPSPISSKRGASINLEGALMTYQVVTPFVGYDNYSYLVTDGLATVERTIVIISTNVPPQSSDKSFARHWREIRNGTLIPVTEGDHAGNDGDTLQLKSVFLLTTSRPCSIQIDESNKLMVHVSANSDIVLGNDPIRFIYTVSDGVQDSSSLVTIMVISSDLQCPSNVSLTSHWRSIQDNGLLIQDVVSNCAGDNQEDVSHLFISTFSPSTYPNAKINISSEGGNLVYIPPPFTSLEDFFDIVVSDGLEHATMKVFVNITNNSPVITQNLIERTIFWRNSTEIIIECSDEDGDPLFFDTYHPPQQGTLNFYNGSSGKALYSPHPKINFTGEQDTEGRYVVTDSFSYLCTDKVGTVQGQIQLTIYNIPPPIKNLSVVLDRNVSHIEPYKFNVLEQIGISDDHIYLSAVSTTGSSAISISDDKKVIYYRPGNTFIGIENISFAISDGSIEREAFYTVEMRNNAPQCSSIVIEDVKKTIATSNISLSRANCVDVNNDIISFKVPEKACQKGTLIFDDTQRAIQYKSHSQRSGIDNCTIIASDGFEQVSFTAIFNIINQAPVIQGERMYEFMASHLDVTHVLDVLKNVTDPDVGDVVSLSSIADQSNCLNSSSEGGSLKIDGNTVKYAPKYGFWGRNCSFSFEVIDNDQDNAMKSVGIATIFVKNLPPIARNDFIEADNNQINPLLIPTHDLLKNDEDPNNFTLSFDGIHCVADDQNYCRRQPSIIQDGEFISIPVNHQSCDRVIFDYTIKKLDGQTARATVIVQYRNCTCRNPMDIIFVIDGSSSITTSNWNLITQLVSNISSKFEVGNDATRIGVTQFGHGTSNTWEQHQYCRYKWIFSHSKWEWEYINDCVQSERLGFHLMGTSNEDIKQKSSQLIQMVEYRGALLGLKSGISHLEQFGRSHVPKVLLVLTNSAANVPCDCTECSTHHGHPDGCKHEKYWPQKTCSDCKWEPSSGNWCMPCAEPRTITDQVNARNDWRVGAIGIEGSSQKLPDIAWKQIQGMAKSKNLAFRFDWDQLQSHYQSIVDATCDQTTFEW